MAIPGLPGLSAFGGSANNTAVDDASMDPSSSSSSSASALPDVTAFAAMARRSLTDALDRTPSGPKTLVLDAVLAGPLGLIAEMPTLRDHGVEKMFWLEPGALSQAQKNIVYICRPEISLMRIIADHIKATPAVLNHTYTILLTPRVTSICASTLEDLGVLGSIDLQEFPMSLIPLERDVLSLELPSGAYREIFLDSNYDAIYEMARALLTLQRAFGLIPRILGKGDAARRLVDIMYRLRSELPTDSNSNPSRTGGMSNYSSSIDSIIILDRQVDMVTLLCTQLTYEGLVDEIIGIKNSSINVDVNLVNPPVPPTPSSSTTNQFNSNTANIPKKKKYLLSTLSNAQAGSSSGAVQAGASNSADPLFADLRDKNFAVIGEVLNKIAKRINLNYEERHKATTVGQMKEFVGKLSSLQNEHQALRLHTGLTEQIFQVTRTDEFNRMLEVQQNLVAGIDIVGQESVIRDLINQEANVYSVLRLLCLYSLIAGGIKAKTMDEIKKDLLQTYGYEYLPLLISLTDLNIFAKNANSSSPSKSVFNLVRRPLKLIVDDVDEGSPKDISYVYSGYAPISCRIVQNAIASASGAPSLLSTGNATSSGSRDRNSRGINGWKGLEEVMKTLPGAVFQEVQRTDGELNSAISGGKSSSRLPATFNTDQIPVTVVCFVGGCTFTEVAALRFHEPANVEQKASSGNDRYSEWKHYHGVPRSSKNIKQALNTRLINKIKRQYRTKSVIVCSNEK